VGWIVLGKGELIGQRRARSKTAPCARMISLQAMRSSGCHAREYAYMWVRNADLQTHIPPRLYQALAQGQRIMPRLVNRNLRCKLTTLTGSRFSLVPDEANAPAPPTPAQQDQSTQQPSQTPHNQSPGPSTMSQHRPGLPARTESGNIVTSVLQRLWGPSGTSNPASPTAETRPQTSRAPSPSQIDRHTDLPHSGADRPDAISAGTRTESEQMSNAIPEDYRERHRRREREQQQQQRDPM